MDFRLTELANSMVLQTEKNELVANNLANTNTVGFKRDVPFFELLADKTDEFSKLGTYRDYDQGPLKDTGNPLDIAITGNGFFTVDVNGSERYTRDGHFSVDSDGFLITREGYHVLGEGGWIALSNDGLQASEININSDGEIFSDGMLMDKLLVTSFENPDKLKRASGNYFLEGKGARAQAAENIVVSQGKLEGSNLNPVGEMVSLIEIQRNFESVQNVVKTLDKILERAATRISNVG